MKNTTNYNLPTYEGTDSPNLITGYNQAMTIIDTTMKTIADNVEFNPQPATDANFDVSKLSGAKITSNGIVYFPNNA